MNPDACLMLDNLANSAKALDAAFTRTRASLESMSVARPTITDETIDGSYVITIDTGIVHAAALEFSRDIASLADAMEAYERAKVDAS